MGTRVGCVKGTVHWPPVSRWSLWRTLSPRPSAPSCKLSAHCPEGLLAPPRTRHHLLDSCSPCPHTLLGGLSWSGNTPGRWRREKAQKVKTGPRGQVSVTFRHTDEGVRKRKTSVASWQVYEESRKMAEMPLLAEQKQTDARTRSREGGGGTSWEIKIDTYTQLRRAC